MEMRMQNAGNAILEPCRQGAAVKIVRTTGKKMLADGSWADNTGIFEGEDYDAAERKFRCWERECYGYDPGMPLGDLIEQYIYEILIPDKEIRYNTKLLYIETYRKHMMNSMFCRKPLESVRPIDLQLFYAGLPCSGNAVRLLNSLLMRFYRFLQLRIPLINAAEQVTVPSQRRRPNDTIEIWSDEELKRIRANLAASPRIRFLIIMLINTGCRISELLALTWEDFVAGSVIISKQLLKVRDMRDTDVPPWFDFGPPKSDDSVRRIPLSDEALRELEKHREWQVKDMARYHYRTEMLFTSKHGNPYDKRSLTVAFGRFYDRIGVPRRGYHVYRHTFGTNLCRSGVPIQVAAKLLGHANINVTARYYVNVDEDQKAEAIRKLNAGPGEKGQKESPSASAEPEGEREES